MHYSVVIRTLGLGKNFYQKCLDSIAAQTIKPDKVLVYIAEGYDIPHETIGIEQYVRVKKGMVAQRALKYDEVETDYILFLDDDVYLPENAVENLYSKMLDNEGDVISPCVFYNHEVSFGTKIRLSISGKERCRLFGSKWAYKVMRTSGFSYNNHPSNDVYLSQSNAGPCFFCRKQDFLSIDYEAESWLDSSFYAIPDDQVMFYKMYVRGLKVLTIYHSGILHLDASTTVQVPEEKYLRVIHSENRNKFIFWHRFIFSLEKNLIKRVWCVVCFAYYILFQYMKYTAKYLLFGNKNEYQAFINGVTEARLFILSQVYKQLPTVL